MSRIAFAPSRLQSFAVHNLNVSTHQKTITDAQASSIIRRWIESQIGQAQTRQKYIPLFEKVVPGKKVALFFQIDRRLYAVLDMQVASQIPLIVN